MATRGYVAVDALSNLLDTPETERPTVGLPLLEALSLMCIYERTRDRAMSGIARMDLIS
ncbi:hypothetical protein RGR602_PC00866 (plasmid) [Rhizobium gallicum bv. gallicum R602sp]|uniref:Uncharacterized protein n=1 Tax=Rhizobium gallicum bv. gallicum R602sp TaxID=1041138 RepID=A0A0B4XDR1_9HYPH|nr:hypothetical protein RGR602_PC00866 [Rhizobium gallicum bv. gallicum R602sp]